MSIDHGRCAHGEYCKKETLCHGQGLARAPFYLLRSYAGTQTAIDFSLVFILLLSLKKVLSDTFSTSSCSKKHLTSKDSLTYWHPWSR